MADEFRQALSSSPAVLVAYESSPDADFAGVMQQMLQPRPDGLSFISGALDVARLEVPKVFTAQDALRAMHGHVLAEASTWGTYSLHG